jgi:hypothetical protein
MTIKRELSDLEGVTHVEGDASTKTATVTWKAPTTEKNIKALLAEINYPAT